MKQAISMFWLVTLSAAGAMAHPGHGESPSDSLAHYLGDPSHMALAMAVSAFAVGVLWKLLTRAPRRS